MDLSESCYARLFLIPLIWSTAKIAAKARIITLTPEEIADTTSGHSMFINTVGGPKSEQLIQYVMIFHRVSTIWLGQIEVFGAHPGIHEIPVQ